MADQGVPVVPEQCDGCEAKFKLVFAGWISCDEYELVGYDDSKLREESIARFGHDDFSFGSEGAIWGPLVRGGDECISRLICAAELDLCKECTNGRKTLAAAAACELVFNFKPFSTECRVLRFVNQEGHDAGSSSMIGGSHVFSAARMLW